MSWFFVDDEFPDCDKLDLLPPKMLTACVGLWTLAGAWSRRNNAGGDIPEPRVSKLGGTLKEADLLVSCGLWERTETGYRFHDWADWQETPEEVEDKRKQTKIRVRRWREAKRRKSDVTALHERYRNACNADVTQGVPGEGVGESTYRVDTRDRDRETPSAPDWMGPPGCQTPVPDCLDELNHEARRPLRAVRR